MIKCQALKPPSWGKKNLNLSSKFSFSLGLAKRFFLLWLKKRGISALFVDKTLKPPS